MLWAHGAADAQTFTIIDVPVANACQQASKVNPRGDIVGVSAEVLGVKGHGYLFRDSAFTFFDFPGAPFTQINGINPAGDMVGQYVATDGKTRGFFLSGGQFTTIDVAGSSFTRAAGINPAGEIVGRYQTLDGGAHGYV